MRPTQDEDLRIIQMEVAELKLLIEGLIEYLGSDVLKRKIEMRSANEPLNRSKHKTHIRATEKVTKVNKIRAKLKTLGCEFDESRKSHVKIIYNGKTLAVMSPSGKLERKVIVDGVTGWKKTKLKKLIRIINKRKE